jgi:hypothetical protein
MADQERNAGFKKKVTNVINKKAPTKGAQFWMIAAFRSPGISRLSVRFADMLVIRPESENHSYLYN